MNINDKHGKTARIQASKQVIDTFQQPLFTVKKTGYSRWSELCDHGFLGDIMGMELLPFDGDI